MDIFWYDEHVVKIFKIFIKKSESIFIKGGDLSEEVHTHCHVIFISWVWSKYKWIGRH